jgi:hypothetical protein
MNVFKSSNIFENKKDEYVNKPYNQFKSYNTASKVSQKKDFEIKDCEFPELSSPSKNNSDNKKSFSSLLKKEEPIKTIKIEEKTEEIVPPGWFMYKYRKLNSKFYGNYSKLTSKIENDIIDYKNTKVELNECEEIINALSYLYEKRTNKYKEDWGEDEWEQMFIYPNYDYEYFDKLDEAYEIEQNKIIEEQQDDYNDYEEYKKYDDY